MARGRVVLLVCQPLHRVVLVALWSVSLASFGSVCEQVPCCCTWRSLSPHGCQWYSEHSVGERFALRGLALEASPDGTWHSQ